MMNLNFRNWIHSRPSQHYRVERVMQTTILYFQVCNLFFRYVYHEGLGVCHQVELDKSTW